MPVRFSSHLNSGEGLVVLCAVHSRDAARRSVEKRQLLKNVTINIQPTFPHTRIWSAAPCWRAARGSWRRPPSWSWSPSRPCPASAGGDSYQGWLSHLLKIKWHLNTTKRNALYYSVSLLKISFHNRNQIGKMIKVCQSLPVVQCILFELDSFSGMKH